MEIGIPGLETRELWIAILMVALAALGSFCNYLWFKADNGKKGTLQGALRSIVIGAVAGFLLAALTKGGEQVGHWDATLIALAWGFASETVVGKFRGAVGRAKASKALKKDKVDEEKVEKMADEILKKVEEKED